jgi:hypothetical protein
MALERMRLLVHILRMIVKSREKQCATVQNLGLNIRKGEEATIGSMSNWFNDKEHPENAAKEAFLEEIFQVAKAEERYNNREIGTIAQLCAIRTKDLPGLVDNTTSIPEIHGSDITESDEVIKDDDEHEAMPFPVSIPTLDSRVLPTSMVQNQPLQQPDSSDFYKVPPIPVSHYSQPHWPVDRFICDGKLQDDASANDHPEQALPPHILEQRQNILAYRGSIAVPGHCMHCFNFLQSDHAFIKWVCLMCQSGPYQNMFECKYCKLKACRPCFNMALIQTY